MTDSYAVTMTIPDSLWMTTLTHDSIDARRRKRARLRAEARRLWRRSKAPKAGRFIVLCGVQYPDNPGIPMFAAETLKPVIDAGTDCGLWTDDDPRHRAFTGYFTVSGHAPKGTHRLYVFVIPSTMPAPSGLAALTGGAGAFTRSFSIGDADWLTSNMRLPPAKRRRMQERVVAASLPRWAGLPTLGRASVLIGVRYPHPHYPGDPDNTAETASAVLEAGFQRGVLPRRPGMTGFYLAQGTSRPGMHDMEVLCIDTDISWAVALTA